MIATCCCGPSFRLPTFIVLVAAHSLLSSGIVLMPRLLIAAGFAGMTHCYFVTVGVAVSFGVISGCCLLVLGPTWSLPCHLLNDVEEFCIVLLEFGDGVC